MVVDKIINLIIGKLQDPKKNLTTSDLFDVFSNSSESRSKIINAARAKESNLDTVLANICESYLQDLNKKISFQKDERRECLLFIYILYYLSTSAIPIKSSLQQKIKSQPEKIRKQVDEKIREKLKSSSMTQTCESLFGLLGIIPSSSDSTTGNLMDEVIGKLKGTVKSGLQFAKESLSPIEKKTHAIIQSFNSDSKDDNPNLFELLSEEEFLELQKKNKLLAEKYKAAEAKANEKILSPTEKKATNIIAYFDLRVKNENFDKFPIVQETTSDEDQTKNLKDRGLKLLNAEELSELREKNSALATKYEAAKNAMLFYNQKLIEVNKLQTNLVTYLEESKRIPPTAIHLDRTESLGDLQPKFLKQYDSLTKFVNFYNRHSGDFKRALSYLSMDPQQFSIKLSECKNPTTFEMLELSYAFAQLGIWLWKNDFSKALTHYFSALISVIPDSSEIKDYVKILLTSKKLNLQHKLTAIKSQIDEAHAFKIIEEYPGICLALLQNAIVLATAQIESAKTIDDVCQYADEAINLFQKYIVKIFPDHRMTANDIYEKLYHALNAAYTRFLDQSIAPLRECNDFLIFKNKRSEILSALEKLEYKIDTIQQNLYNYTIVEPLGDHKTLQKRLDTEYNDDEKAEIKNLFQRNKTREQQLQDNKTKRDNFVKDIESFFILEYLENTKKEIDKSCDIHTICGLFTEACQGYRESKANNACELSVTRLRQSLITAYARIIEIKTKELKSSAELRPALEDLKKLEDAILETSPQLPKELKDKKENLEKLGPKLDKLKRNVLSVVDLLNRLDHPEQKGGFLCFHWMPKGVEQLQKYKDITAIEKKGLLTVTDDIKRILETRLNKHSFFCCGKPFLRDDEIHAFYRAANTAILAL